ncbi:hypothetical protein [Geoalkalibacter halelectricus]|uniref:Uncharacterized protein n=1 Tax=Geoalkalibacter halelectricus TaxID=2847045 RepID=A0ABY5ZL20_9BACT|nr:hypothetical protein [Geoalkalibacter halelectricus]MDO3378270.1 hypothetical protein [Geoalkalibacter halelectricus]UWZ79139.1 hypothetical protein L9S41_15855 [Geoalkalibacter halelectricus]
MGSDRGENRQGLARRILEMTLRIHTRPELPIAFRKTDGMEQFMLRIYEQAIVKNGGR